MVVPVSVIIPFYNAHRHFPKTLCSLRRQSAAPAEIIVIDDGSDAPAARALLRGLDDDIKLISLPSNAGPGVARNAGARIATQPYLAFLDTDDLWRPRKLEVQYAFMSAWPELDMTHTQVAFATDGGTLSVGHLAQQGSSARTALTNYLVATPSVMIKRSSFERIGGFDPHLRCAQDWDLYIRMVLAGFQIQCIAEELVEVRREGHGHHSSDWRCYLAGHLRIVMKHRRAYVRHLGVRRWLHQLAFELYRGGGRQGKTLGSVLKIPYRIGV